MSTAARQITVSGRGEASAAPDLAYVHLGVRTTAPTARQALTENNQQMQALIDRLRERGVAERDLRTSRIGLGQEYTQPGIDAPRTYYADNTLTIIARDVAEFGALLDTLVDAGANQINGLEFAVADRTALEQAALAAAIADAQARAAFIAQTLGVALGDVLSLNDSLADGPVTYADHSLRAAKSAVPVEAGTQTITAHVHITFAIRDQGLGVGDQ